MSQGKKFKEALDAEKPLQLIGVINAYCAMMAERTGFKAIYLSGGGVANASYGLPDLGITGLNDVLEDVKRITSATDLPLLVDMDTGWGGAFNIARTVRQLIKSGAAGAHIEDQVSQKRCGHRPNKSLVSTSEMCDRIRAAVDAKTDSDFVVMARTDALANEGFEAAVERIQAYVEAGADMIFPEAFNALEQYSALDEKISRPFLANITEFGKTPLFTRDELKSAGVSMVLYPLSAFRAMNQAALEVFKEIREKGTQKGAVDKMQTRDELYDFLGYHGYENKLDELYGE